MDCIEGMKLLDDKSIDMILCDLPYGTTACKWDTIIPFDVLWEQYERLIKPNGAIVLTASQPFTSLLITSNLKMFKYTWVWDKVTPVGHTVAKLRPMQQHEDICVFSNGATANGSKRLMEYHPQGLVPYGKTLDGSRKQKDNQQNQYRRESHKQYVQEFTNYPKSIITFNKEASKVSVHPTQKPVALGEYLVRTYTNEGDLVLDNCTGSGSFLVAAKNTGRSYLGFELEEKYYDIAKERLSSCPGLDL